MSVLMTSILLFAIAQPVAEPPAAPEAAVSEVTLERIMADPDWIGRLAENPVWADDSGAVYFQRKRAGSSIRDWFILPLDAEGERLVDGAIAAEASVAGGDWSLDRQRKVFARNGDIFLRDLASNELRQLTRTQADERSPRFMRGDEAITFVRDGGIFVRHLASGLEEEAVHLAAADDPLEEKPDEGFLAAQQRRLFDVLTKRREDREAARRVERERQAEDPSRVDPTWYLGKDVQIVRTALSPDGHFAAVVLADKGETSGKADAMPNYVTESGYVESRTVRSKVGTGKDRAERLVILDLRERKQHKVDLTALPMISDDPLATFREEAEARKKAAKEEASKKVDATEAASEPQGEGATEATQEPEKEPKEETKAKPRAVRFGSLLWNPRDEQLAVQIFSHDNKDRWIAVISPRTGALAALEHDRDEAWINTRFSACDWLADGSALWFLSERTGWSHLYVRNPDFPETRALTQGEYEVSDVTPSPDGRHLYFQANRRHRGEYEVHRVLVADGTQEQLTDLRAMTDYDLSPDGRRLLLRHSQATRPPELFVQAVGLREEPRRLTFFTEPDFESTIWREPEYVEIPSPHGPAIPARFYPTFDPHPARPAVIFIHGAGYLQNAHKGWSSYFREFMFHTLLANAGYAVLDLDYRASAGYGRDWRTAIYRQMGTPEVQDLVSAAAWLVENEGVDPGRIGIYGGSYGGFLTLMALFTEPEVFACGAALRPVTDWAHYNHGYTSNILNVPQLDPEAYNLSSPIEFAAGLKGGLLICHGMLDDNVFYQDTVRLAQRLIELEKTDWEVAAYPLEAHGFVEPSSWLDEYRRIFKLFETHLKRE